MVIYNSADIYIESQTTLKAKIIAIDAVITALEAMALKAAATGNVDSYTLDTGQSKTTISYRNIDQLAMSLTSFERIRQTYINRLNGRGVRLVDGKNFTGRNNG